MEIDYELLKLEKELKKVKIEQRYDNYTFLDVINKIKDENIVSNWLKFLFNPHVNGIGNELIKKLIEIYNKKNNKSFSIKNQRFISIDREIVTKNIEKKRRMDLFIEYDNLWIIIENKINSLEHDKQTLDYYQNIEKIRENVDNVIYIYLKPDWNSSEPECNEFKIIKYSELIEEFKKIDKDLYIEKEKYLYLKNFIEVGEKYYMGKNEIEVNRDNLEIYINNMKKIREITEQYDKYVEQIINRIIEGIKENISEFNNDLVKNSYKSNPRGYIQFVKPSWKKIKDNEIHFELLSTNFKDFIGKRITINHEFHVESSKTNKEKENIREEIRNAIKELQDSNINLSGRTIISVKKEYDFTDLDNIEKESQKIIIDFFEVVKRYMPILDKVINNLGE